MEFRILGPLEVDDGDRPVPLPSGRGRALLALLVLHAGEVVSAERLVDDLWGETPPPTAPTALQGLVSALRKRLEPSRRPGEVPGVLGTRPPGYVLAIDPDDVDANRFRRLLEEAGGLPASERAAQLHRALSLWRGPALAEFTYEPFAQAEIAALEELRLSALEGRIDADLALGRHGSLVGELERLVARCPLRERLRGQLMLALYRSGRQAEALEAYRAAREGLLEELGIEPGPALQRLEQAILRQDTSLDTPAPVPLEAVTEPAAAGPAAAARPWLPQGRKTVTVVFLDVAPSTSPGQHLDPEAGRKVVGRFLDTAAGVVTRHGGAVETFIGDVLVGIFGVPAAHEDDALRAVRAAIEIRHALGALNEEPERVRGVRLAIRAGIGTGETLIAGRGREQPMVSGDAVKVAARLQHAAAEGEVLVSVETRRLVQDAALLEPAVRPALSGGGSRPIAAWSLLDLLPGAPVLARRLDATIVGRDAELAELHAAFERTLRERRGGLLTLLGEPGIGKSRLAREFARTIGSAPRVLTGHCPAYGEGITFWPLREVVAQAAGRAGRDALLDLLAGERDAERIADPVASAIGLTEGPGRPGDLFPAVRLFLEALARKRPVALILEDLHWAQPTLLDLVEYLAEWTREAVLLLCVARPDLLEERPDLGKGKAASLVLEPLGPEDTEKLIADRLAGRTLRPEVVARIAGTAQGNPLFLEQMVAALRDEGEFTIPLSVNALLAARLDRLGPAERDLIRCASVMGSTFSAEALVALVPEEARPFAARHLGALERKEFLRTSRPALPTKEAYGFRHVLIQVAAYRSLTREARSNLHERFAEWLESEAPERPPELEEIAGYHLEQALEQRRALGSLDQHGRGLAVRAGERLASAGARAYRRYDVSAAENLLSRARSLLPPDHPELPRVVRPLAEAYQVLGRHAQADAVLCEMLQAVGDGGDPRLLQAIRLERAKIRLHTGPDPVGLKAILAEAERALEVFGEPADEAGLAKACFILLNVHLRRGELHEMEQAARRGLAHAERAGDAREELAGRWMVASALLEGPTPVAEGIRQCDELGRWRGTEHPGVLCELAHLRAMLSQFEEARELVSRARRLFVERMHVRRPLMFGARSSAAVEILAGDVVAGERELRTALTLALEMREREWVSQLAAHLARILSGLDDPEEAERFAALSVEHAPAEHVGAQALSRAARARVLAVGRDLGEAQRLAREAIRLVPGDMLSLRGDLLLDLAEVLREAGEAEAALPVVGEAIEAYESKGNIVSAARARSLA